MQAFLDSIGLIRQRARGDMLSDAEKREIIEALDARVYAWSDGENRHVRVELPFGTACGNLDTTSASST